MTHGSEPPQLAIQMIALGMMVLAAHLGGKLARRFRVSEVTGQLLGGALVGPYALGLFDILGPYQAVYESTIHGFHFLVFVFLGVIAFGIGEELHIDRLRAIGRSALAISVIQGGFTWALMSAAFYYIGKQPLMESLIIGSIGSASAPVVTFVIMDQLKIEGRLRNMVGSVIVIGDVLQVVIFSILVQLANPARPGGSGIRVAFSSARELLFAILLGALVFLVLRLLVWRSPTCLQDEDCHELPPGAAFLQRILAEHPSPSAEIFLIVLGAVAVSVGIGYANHLPFIVSAVIAGVLVANFHSHVIFDSLKIESITPIINLMFFALIGANLSLSSLTGEYALLVVLYVGSRFAGKLGGTWMGCRLAREDKKITAVLPDLMLPQAGVAAVEAVFVAALLPDSKISAIILPAIVVFEVVGVALVDRTLRRWRSWVADEEAILKHPPPAGMVEAAGRALLYLEPSRLVLDLDGTTKEEVIRALVHAAGTAPGLKFDTDQAMRLIMEREKLAPTGFGHGVAIPHCRLAGLDKPILVFGRHPGGVPFGGVDDRPCDLIMLIISSGRDPSQHLRLLSAAGHIFSDTDVRRQLRTAKTATEVLEVLEGLARRPADIS